MKNTLSFSNAAKAAAACAICAVACLLVGWLSSLFQGESLSQWYPLIKKPSFTPPSMVFPIAWCILYVLSGISAGLVLTSPKEGKQRQFLFFAPSYSRTFCGASCSLACTTPLQVSPTLSCCLYWLHCTPSAHGIFQKQPLLYSSLTSCGARSLQS